MKTKWLAAVLAAPLLTAGLVAVYPRALPSGAAPGAPAPVDGAERRAMIATLIARLNEHYVFADKAKSMEALLRARERDYERIADGATLARTVTADLASVAHDANLAVTYGEQPAATTTSATWPQWLQAMLHLPAQHGVAKLERLPADIGYIALTSFAPPEVAGPQYAQALQDLAGTSAVIVDLRHNGGGSIDSARLLASYFVDRPLPLNEVHYRDSGRTERPWTVNQLGAPAHLGKMYVLTSRDTQGAAEDFAYTMQAMKRAIIAGETTRGGANVASPWRLSAHFSSSIPNGRPLNPVTQANWDGVGVAPDVPVPAAEALRTAKRTLWTERLARASNTFGYLALKKLLAEL